MKPELHVMNFRGGYHPNECMANVGVGFSQDLVASSQGMGPAFHGYPKVGKSQVFSRRGSLETSLGTPCFSWVPQGTHEKARWA